MSSVPKIIKDVGFDFWWDSEKVWDLSVPVTEINIADLDWHLDYPFWGENGFKYNLKPADVINFPDKHNFEYKRIMKADLYYPIDIMENKGRWLILDGLHRLAKAVINKKERISVRIISRDLIANILHDRAISDNHPDSIKYLKLKSAKK